MGVPAGVDVEDQAGSDGDGKVGAAGGAAVTIDSMQVEEEAIEATDLREAAGCEALPTDGGVWQQLERELKCAWQERAGQVLGWARKRGLRGIFRGIFGRV